MNQMEMEIFARWTQKQEETIPVAEIVGLGSKVFESGKSYAARCVSFAPIVLQNKSTPFASSMAPYWREEVNPLGNHKVGWLQFRLKEGESSQHVMKIRILEIQN